MNTIKLNNIMELLLIEGYDVQEGYYRNTYTKCIIGRINGLRIGFYAEKDKYVLEIEGQVEKKKCISVQKYVEWIKGSCIAQSEINEEEKEDYEDYEEEEDVQYLHDKIDYDAIDNDRYYNEIY